jgi:hypothetical protein
MMVNPGDAFQGVWHTQPTLVLCDRLAREGIALVARDGVCPAHGGDACLVSYVQVSGTRDALYALAGRP